MWFYIDPASGVPIYLQIINQVKKAAATGLLKPGDRLPSVRDLATELTVNPNTIAKAYHELEREGIIYTERGKGTFLAPREPKLLPEERRKMLEKLIDALLVEAHHLRFTKDEVREIINRRLEEWFNETGRDESD
ncbi:MAG: GntR family transcriptional regulator [Eubacteriales bacterium]|nr:GntR family transcriptional regulator [Eubacteriales bacterium]MDN5364685.1 GntR family transcriptional regulator [Eubacteriales bacterium]